MRTLDQLRRGRRYFNRSEFVHDMLRGELMKQEGQEQPGETTGVLVLVYDHDIRALSEARARHPAGAHSVPSVKGVRDGQRVPATTGKRLR
jgi:metal-responsive CopG/Arc/MetJ family transcriptional regulator